MSSAAPKAMSVVSGPRLLVAVCLALVGAAAPAQQLYRCGNTYSQVPCAGDAEPKKMYRDNTPGGGAAASQAGKDLCRRQLPAAVGLADPYSVVFESVGDPKHDTIRIGAELVVAKRIDVALNAKNEFGAYTGVQVYRCYVSEDEQRLLKVQAPGRR